MRKKARRIILGLIITSIIISMTGIGYVLYTINGINLDKNKLGNNTVDIYDDESSIISSLNNYVEYQDIPTDIINAFVSTEDKRYFEHNGIDTYRIASAILNDLKTLSLKEGASTISQQLIKNTHLNNEKTITRKIKEIKLALELENYYTKEEILEYYLNMLYFGGNIYGIGNASYKFFNKKIDQLTLEECATIAGIVKSPRLYSPTFNYDNSINRRNLILKNMYEQNYISKSQYLSAKSKDLIINEGYDIASSYKQAVIDEAKVILNLDEKDILNGKYKIYTYYNEKTQINLDKSIKNNKVNNVSGNAANASSLILDNNTGGVQAYFNNTNTSCYDLIRQPGSIIKPFVSYLPALSSGLICPDSIINDQKMSFGDYSPNNFHGKYYGNITIRDAVCKSSNSVAVQLMNNVGVYTSIDYATKYGLKFSNYDYNLSTALGGVTEGMSLLDLGSAYMTLANSGYYIKPCFIRIVEDEFGNIVYKNKNKYVKVEDECTCYLMTSILHSVTQNGTAKMLSSLPFYLASKTGTVAGNTGNNTDVWNATYDTANTYIVWFGNTTGDSKNDISASITGGSKPTKVVHDLIKWNSNYSGSFIEPSTVKKVYIDEHEYIENNNIVLSNFKTNKKIICNKKFYDNLVANYLNTFINIY